MIYAPQPFKHPTHHSKGLLHIRIVHNVNVLQNVNTVTYKLTIS